MERIEKMAVKVGSGYTTYREDKDIIKALNNMPDNAIINLELVTVGEDGYIQHTQVEDICIDDIRVIGGEVFYNPAE